MAMRQSAKRAPSRVAAPGRHDLVAAIGRAHRAILNATEALVMTDLTAKAMTLPPS